MPEHILAANRSLFERVEMEKLHVPVWVSRIAWDEEDGNWVQVTAKGEWAEVTFSLNINSCPHIGEKLWIRIGREDEVE